MLQAVGRGAERPSEIARRLGTAQTNLSRLLLQLLDASILKRELPFGENVRSTKKTLYRIQDPTMRFWFRVFSPHQSRWRTYSAEEKRKLIHGHAATVFEDECRARFPGAQRYWEGNVQLDLVAPDPDDPQQLLVAEVKWRRLTVGERKNVSPGHTLGEVIPPMHPCGRKLAAWLPADEAVLEGVLDEFGGGFHAELLHDRILVERHRAERHAQNRGDLFQHPAFRQQPLEGIQQIKGLIEAPCGTDPGYGVGRADPFAGAVSVVPHAARLPQSAAMSGLVLSDLHLFARRSEGEARFTALGSDLRQTRTLVLNGDIFDFRWSTRPSLEATIAAACDWLDAALGAFPDCQVHYVLGNHDCLAAFESHLTALADRQARFAWHPFWLRLGPSVFLHGDCAQRKMDLDGLRNYRAPWRSDQPRGALPATAYAWADRLGITRLVHEWQFPRRATVARLVHFLDRECPGWRGETRDCFFGHTHLPFSDYEHEGIRFHNAGSGIRGAVFNPCRFATGTLKR